MYHYTYKITSSSGKYYVGRHSTDRLEDGYMGSGKWPRSIKNKKELTKEILSFFQTIEELIEAERMLLNENIDNVQCMNFNNSPMGWGIGDKNPNRQESAKERLRERFLGDLNPMRRDDVRLKNSLSQRGNIPPNKGKPHTEETKQKISRSKTGSKMSEEGRRKLSESRKRQFANGERIPPSWLGRQHTEQTKERMRNSAIEKPKIRCPHCGTECKPHTYKRWHGDNCKMRIF